MASTTVRVSGETHAKLRELSAKTGESITEVVDRALDLYRRQQFFEELDASYDRLWKDPTESQLELEERALFEGTLSDDLGAL